MNFDEENNSEVQQRENNNVLHDEDAMYLSAERQRIKQAILKTNTDKFFLLLVCSALTRCLKMPK